MSSPNTIPPDALRLAINVKDHRGLVRVFERKCTERFAGLLRLGYQSLQLSLLLIRKALSILRKNGLIVSFRRGRQLSRLIAFKNLCRLRLAGCFACDRQRGRRGRNRGYACEVAPGQSSPAFRVLWHFDSLLRIGFPPFDELPACRSFGLHSRQAGSLPDFK